MKIGIEQLKIGDKLTEDIVNLNGTRIAQAGSIVDEVLFRRCKTWLIKTVEIESEKSTDMPIEHTAGDGIASMGVNPVMDKILQVAEKIKSQRLSKLVAK